MNRTLQADYKETARCFALVWFFDCVISVGDVKKSLLVLFFVMGTNASRFLWLFWRCAVVKHYWPNLPVAVNSWNFKSGTRGPYAHTHNTYACQGFFYIPGGAVARFNEQ